jgi:hypothetical protein
VDQEVGVIEVEASVVIDRPAEAILEWVSDLERYRAADTKISKVLHQDPPVRIVAEGYLRRWLERDIADEMARLKQLVEADA